MTNAAHSTHWRGLRARCLALTSILAILGTVPLYGAEGARPGSADRCSGGDCASSAVRGVTVYRGLVLDYEVIDGLAVHGGDMVLGTAEEAAAAAPAREPAKREASPGPVRRDLYHIENGLWPGGRVPYVIDDRIEGEDLEAIHAAIEHWNTKTVIDWFPRTDERQYALFLPVPEGAGACYSGLGVGSPTEITAGGCHFGTVIHEMGHAVGLLHEHARPDWDRFLDEEPFVFSVYAVDNEARSLRDPRGDVPELPYPYDYRSIMHYMLWRARTIPPGMLVSGFSYANSLSPGDIDGVARLYGKHPGTITVSTNPPGLDVIVDGDRVTTPALFEWLPDSVHTLEAPLVQQQTYVYGRWSDGGGRKHTVRAGPDSTWFEANYIHLFRVRGTTSPPNAGTVGVSPEFPDGRNVVSTPLELTPVPTEGTPYEFARWDLSSSYPEWRLPGAQPAYGSGLRPTVRTLWPNAMRAIFQTPPFYRINSNVEGMLLPFKVNGRRSFAPAAFQPSELPAGTTVSVPESGPVLDRLGSSGRYRFIGWSDGGEREHEIEAPAGGGSLTFRVQREFQLATHTNSGEIVVSPESEDGFYPAGSQVQLTAVPEAGRHFLGWEHDVSGTETTQFVIMDRDRRASAKFTRDEPILVQFGEPLQTDSLNGRHYVRLPDGTSQVAVRFEASAPSRDAAFSVHSGFRIDEVVSTRLRESDTITITRDALSRMRNSARRRPESRSHHLRIQQRGGVGSGKLHVSIQRDWIDDVWPQAFTLVSQVGWSRPVRQPMRIAPVEGVPPQVRYRIVSDRHWLEAVPPEWTSAEGEVEIAVTANGAALAAEAYAGKLRILTVSDSDPPAGGTPTGIEIPVHFVVKPADGAEEPTGDESSGLAGGDDHGDTRAAATEIAAGASAQGRLERVGDEDWFRFRTTAAYTFVTAYTVSAGDTVGELHPAGGAVVTDDDSGSGGNFRIAANVPAGTHYLQVRGFGTPDYTLRLEAVPDDHGPARGAATEIATGAAARGRLQAVGDEDWFQFQTTAARTFVTAYTVSAGDTVGELHPAGGAVVTDDDSGSGGNFRIAANVPAGTHYLRVSGFGTPDYTLRLEEEFPMEFVRIPAGSFVMGSPEHEEGRVSNERQREVRISQGFWMGKYEVTQGEWKAVMGTNPSYFKECGRRCPVEGVSWNDIQEFIRSLNEQESGSGYVYRLPTEAEWEYAARAGSAGSTPEGNLRILGTYNAPVLDGQAWYGGNSGVSYAGGFGCREGMQYAAEQCGTHPVGLKKANGWGLHDMLGNVWESTADWFGKYPSGAVTDPQGPDTGSGRVVRGGGWSAGAGYVRSAVRVQASPGRRGPNLGFRLVRTE